MERINVLYPTGEEITFSFVNNGIADIFYNKIKDDPEIVIKRISGSK